MKAKKRGHKRKPVTGYVTLRFRRKRRIEEMAQSQNAQPGQSGVATANELDQFGKPFTISDPSVLVWTVSDSNALTVTSNNDGTAKVTVNATAAAGTYSVTFTDPAAASLQVTPGEVVVTVPAPVATTGSVDLGTFA